VRDDHILDRLLKTVRHDWENSKKLDLSDEGLLAELEQYDPNVARIWRSRRIRVGRSVELAGGLTRTLSLAL